MLLEEQEKEEKLLKGLLLFSLKRMDQIIAITGIPGEDCWREEFEDIDCLYEKRLFVDGMALQMLEQYIGLPDRMSALHN